MIRWIPYTFVRTVLFFIGGILLGLYAPDLIPEKVLMSAVVLLALLYFFVVFFGRAKRRRWNPGSVALLLVFLSGYIHLVWQTESRQPNHLVNIKEHVTHYQAVITRFPEEKDRTWKSEAVVKQVHGTTWRPADGKILLYFSKQDFPEPFRYGDVLIIKGHPETPDVPGNPGEFDYREFLALKNIYHQNFLRKGDVVKIGYHPSYRFMALAYRVREWAEATLRIFISGKREQAIASALVLGVTDGLDDELLNAYAVTGSMHILAVSGLHISILYFILLWVLSPLNKFRRGRWFVAFVALLILWLYAFVTGLSPSVLRAVGMFSFLALARPWARSTNVYNTLAVSAFCLLLFDPFLIRSVGFQLSYLAVVGIVFLYPRILVLWEPRYWFVAEVWKLSAVSIAAQIATFPLGLFYFHQFANYFLLSNLLVVPLSFVVLILGIVLLAVSSVTVIAAAAGFCLEWIIRFLNGIVFTLEGFPFSVVEGVYISAWQCVLLIALIITLITLFQFRKFSHLLVAFMIVLSYVSLQWIHFFREVNIQKITVYNVPGHSALDLIDRGRTYFLADSVMKHDAQKVRYHVNPGRLMAGVRTESGAPPAVRSLKGAKLINWNGRSILHIEDAEFDAPVVLAVDWVIIANNSVPEISGLRDKVAFKKVILDSSNSFFFASRFMEAAKLYKLDVHSVLHQGAFISKIENQDT